MFYLRVSSMPELRGWPRQMRNGLLRQWRREAWWHQGLEGALALATVFGGAVLGMYPAIWLIMVVAPWRDFHYVHAAILAVCCVGVPGVVALWFRALLLRHAVRSVIRRTWRDGRPPVCYACGYDLRGTPADRCPECGLAVPRRPGEA